MVLPVPPSCFRLSFFGRYYGSVFTGSLVGLNGNPERMLVLTAKFGIVASIRERLGSLRLFTSYAATWSLFPRPERAGLLHNQRPYRDSHRQSVRRCACSARKLCLYPFHLSQYSPVRSAPVLRPEISIGMLPCPPAVYLFDFVPWSDLGYNQGDLLS
jgi:hypothetical protein